MTRRAGGRRAVSAEQARNKPEQPHDDESYGDGAGGGVRNEIADPSLAVGKPIVHAFADSPDTLLNLGA